MSKSTTLPIGSLIIFHEGEYSDKTASGPYKILKPFNGDELEAAFRTQWKPGDEEWDDHPDPDEFTAWLFREGYLEPVDGVAHWHIGGYGRLETSELRFGDV
jgi:hypothetical protein